MNIKQLETIQGRLATIRNEIEADDLGSMTVNQALKSFEAAVTEQLRHKVWSHYLKERKQ